MATPGADCEEGCELLRERESSSPQRIVVKQDTKEERNVFIAAKVQLTCGAPHHEAILVIQRGTFGYPGTQSLRNQELLSSPRLYFMENVSPARFAKILYRRSVHSYQVGQ